MSLALDNVADLRGRFPKTAAAPPNPFPRLVASGADFLYRLEEASGTRLDSSPNGNSLTDINTVTSGAGKINTCAVFASASSERLDRAETFKWRINSIGEATIGAWVKPTAASLVGTHIIAAKHSSLGSWILGIDGGQVYCVVFQGAGYDILYATTFGALTAGTWYFAAFMYDPAFILSVGVNDTWDSAACGIHADHSDTCAIGARTYGGAEAYFDGSIDEVFKFPFLLTAGESAYLAAGNAIAA